SVETNGGRELAYPFVDGGLERADGWPRRYLRSAPAGGVRSLPGFRARRRRPMRAQFRSMLVLGTSLLLLGSGCGTSGGGGQPDAGGALCTVSGVSVSGSSANIGPGGAVDLTATLNKTRSSRHRGGPRPGPPTRRGRPPHA